MKRTRQPFFQFDGTFSYGNAVAELRHWLGVYVEFALLWNFSDLVVSERWFSYERMQISMNEKYELSQGISSTIQFCKTF